MLLNFSILGYALASDFTQCFNYYGSYGRRSFDCRSEKGSESAWALGMKSQLYCLKPQGFYGLTITNGVFVFSRTEKNEP